MEGLIKNKKKYSENYRVDVYENVTEDFLKEILDSYINPKRLGKHISSIYFSRTDLGYPIVEVKILIED